MSSSLTKEEFLQRFIDRNKLFQAAIIHDLENINIQIKEQVRIQHDKNNINVDISQLVGKLIGNALMRAVDLVYRDLE